jgi:hypothetical protein
MKNLKKYGCYTLLAVAVFTAFWLTVGFISMEFDMRKWDAANRFLVVALTVCVVAPVIGHKETT